jgi:hypothetical protein
MCNLYRMRNQRSEVVAAVRAMNDRNNNQPPMDGIWPDYAAPLVVNGADRREMREMRWGMPSSKKALLEAARRRAALGRSTSGRDSARERLIEFVFDVAEVWAIHNGHTEHPVSSIWRCRIVMEKNHLSMRIGGPANGSKLTRVGSYRALTSPPWFEVSQRNCSGPHVVRCQAINPRDREPVLLTADV